MNDNATDANSESSYFKYDDDNDHFNENIGNCFLCSDLHLL